MADLRLDVVSEKRGTGAEDAAAAVRGLGDTTRQQAEEVAKATEKWRLMGETAMKAAEKVVEFAREGVKLYLEQAQADRQLALAAGAASEALQEQADVLEKSLGIDAVKTEKMQALLFRFGEAPEKIDETVRALYDYAAVSGTDALGAAEQLTSAINGGRDAFRELGLTYEKTGDKSKDLEAATKALAGKIGGAAEADRDSLSGQMKRAAAEQENMQKAFGGLMAEFLEKTQVVTSLSFAFEKLTAAMKGPDRETIVGDLQAREAALKKELSYFGPEGPVDTDLHRQWEGWKSELKVVHGEMVKIQEADEERSKGLLISNPNAGLTQKAGEKAKEEAAKRLEVHKEERKEESDFTAEQDAADEVLRQNNINAKHNAKMKALEDAAKAEQERANHEDAARKLKEEKDSATARKHAEEEEAAAKRTDEAWNQAAKSAAVSLAQEIGGVLEALAAGEEVKGSDILANILSIGGGFAGAALAATGNPLAGLAVGSLANIGASGVRGLGKRYSFHTGGWVDGLPHHHNGTLAQDEHLAVLQSGERVLSRREVAASGGPQGVDAMARGGRGQAVNVYVSTMDAGGTMEFFQRAGGRAAVNTIRTGIGSLPLLFGGG